MTNIFPEEREQSVLDSVATIPPARSEEMNSRIAIDLTKLKLSREQDASFPELFAESSREATSAPTIEAAFEAETNRHLQSVKDDLRAMLSDSVMDDPDKAAHAVHIAEDIDLLDAVYRGDRGAINAINDQYADESISELAVLQSASQDYVNMITAEWAEEKGILETLTDYVVHALWNPNFILEMNELAQDLTENRMNVRELIMDFQLQHPDVQSALAPEILEHAEEAFGGNVSKVAAFMTMLSSPQAAELMDLEEGFAALDLAGVTAFAATIARPFRSVARTAKINRSAAAAENLYASGVRQRSVREAIAGTEEDIAINASPLRVENTAVDYGNVDGLSAHSQILDFTRREAVADTLEQAKRNDFVIKTDAVTSSDREIIQRNFREDRERRLGDRLLSEISFEDAEGGFTATYTRFDARTGQEITESFPIRFNRNEYDTFDLEIVTDRALDHNALAGFAISPETLLRGTDIVERLTASGGQSARLFNSLVAARKQSVKGLSRRSIRDVDELLLKGDQMGVEFTPQQLRSGGVEIWSGTRRFTDAEIDSYYANRQVLDSLWELENERLRDFLDFLGFRELTFNRGRNAPEERILARRMDSPQSIPEDAVVMVPKRGQNTQEWQRLTRAQIDEMEGQGFQFFERQAPHRLDDGTSSRYVAAITGNRGAPAVFEGLPRQVLNYNPGYVPRIYQRGLYYVKDTARNENVARVFNSRKDAEAWRRSQSNAGDLNVQIDRQLAPEETLAREADAFGGLYTGSRRKDPLLYGFEGSEEIPRMTAAQSIDAYISHVSGLMPINQFRSALLQRFKNTANQLARREGKSSGFIDPADHNSALTLSDSSARGWLENSREYLNTMLRLGDTREKHFQNTLVNWAEWVEGAAPFGERISRKAARSLIDISSKNVSTALRGAAFNTTLGFFNVRQLWVQGQNAVISMSMHPQEAPMALSRAATMRAALFVPDSTVRNSIASIVSKGIDGTSDLGQNINQFYRSGLMDSILRNADYDAARAGFASGSMESLKRVASKGRMFFNEGELMSRLTSWNIARQRWMKANPGAAIDDGVITDLVKETYRLQMNMQRENAARFQRNSFTSVPTQFMQVLAKLLENTMLGITGKGKWSRAEASRVLAGQVALYGMVGIPAGSWALGHLRQFVDRTDEEIANDPVLSGMMEMAHDGAWGLMFETLLGAENQVGPSGNIIGMMNDNILVDVVKSVVTMGDEDVGFFESGLGPSSSVLTRTGDTVIDFTRAIRAVAANPKMKPEDYGAVGLELGKSLARVTSAFNNAETAYMLYKYEEIRTSRGNRVADPLDFPDGVSPGTVLARAMGFPTDIEAMYWENRRQITDHRASINKATDAYVDVVLKFGDNTQMRDEMLRVLLSQYSAIERERIQDSAINRILGEGDSRDALRDVLRIHMESMGREDLPTETFRLHGTQ